MEHLVQVLMHERVPLVVVLVRLRLDPLPLFALHQSPLLVSARSNRGMEFGTKFTKQLCLDG